MYERWQRIVRPEASLFAGVLFVALLGFLRPYQKDFAHVVGILSSRGGQAFHAAHLELGHTLFGQNTIFISADVMPPIAGDIEVTLVGLQALDYTVSSRYPPGVAVRNGNHPWYRFEEGTLKGVHPGDDVGVVVTVKPPTDPGQYELILADPKTGQPYMTVPVLFERPGEPMEAEAPAGGGAWGAPSESEQTEQPTSSSTEDCH